MNIYKKIQKIRVDLQSKDIKKSGKNKYSNFSYYDLSDFMPILNNLMHEEGVTSIFSIIENRPILRLINSDAIEEHVDFELPIAYAELKGAQAIQNLGATSTYLERYLFIIAFQIVESDIVDQQDKVNEESKSKVAKKETVKLEDNLPKATTEQVKQINDLVSKLSKQQWLQEGLKAYDILYVRDLTYDQAERCLTKLKKDEEEINKDIDM